MMTQGAKKSMFENVSEDFKTRHNIPNPPQSWIGWRWFNFKTLIAKALIDTGVKIEPSGVMRNFINEGSAKFLSMVLAEVIQQRILSGNMENVNVAEIKCICGKCNQKPKEEATIN